MTAKTKLIWTAEEIMTKHFKINVQKDNSQATNKVLIRKFLDADEVKKIVDKIRKQFQDEEDTEYIEGAMIALDMFRQELGL